MVTALLLIIYIAFIGLGLPHSLFGAAWPAIQADFALPLSAANYITVLVSGCTVLSSMFGARLVNRAGTWAVVAASTAMAAAALLGFSLSGSLWVMCLFAIPLGLGAGAIDAALNNYIALYYSAMHMNFLHCFYGVGVVVSPYIMSVMLENASWRAGYRTIFLLQAAIAAVMVLSLPLWKRVKHKAVQEEEAAAPRTLSYIEMAKSKLIRLDWLMCIAANAIEGVCGAWGATYLVYAHGLGEGAAAKMITLFYIGMALGRFLSGLLSAKLSSWRLIHIGTACMVLGIVLMFLPVPTVAAAGLFLVGLGNGPIHPNIMHLTPRNFGEDVSGSVIGSQMAAAYFGIMAAPPVFGFLAEKISAALLPLYLVIWILIFVVAMMFFLRLKNHKTNEIQL